MPLRLHISYIKQEINENDELFKEDTLKFTDQQMDKFMAY